MPSRAAVLDILENQQIPQRRLPDFVSTTAALSLTYNTHAGKIVRNTAKNLNITLPLATTAKAGEQYVVMVGINSTTGQDLTLKVTSADKVNEGTSGKGLKNEGSTDSVGDSVTVVSDGTGWYTTAMVGTWLAEA